jgi:hypothetical protein
VKTNNIILSGIEIPVFNIKRSTEFYVGMGFKVTSSSATNTVITVELRTSKTSPMFIKLIQKLGTDRVETAPGFIITPGRGSDFMSIFNQMYINIGEGSESAFESKMQSQFCNDGFVYDPTFNRWILKDRTVKS